MAEQKQQVPAAAGAQIARKTRHPVMEALHGNESSHEAEAGYDQIYDAFGAHYNYEGEDIPIYGLGALKKMAEQESAKKAEQQGDPLNDQLPFFLSEADRSWVNGTEGDHTLKRAIMAEDMFRVKYVPRPRDPELGDAGYKFKLQQNKRVLVTREVEGWYFIQTEAQRYGWVEDYALAFDPPEPSAVIHKVADGESLWSIASSHYGLSDKDDRRLYINVIIYANNISGRGGNIPRDNTKAWYHLGDPYHYNPKLIAGSRIWLPGKAFIKALGKKLPVLTGSAITVAAAAFWDAVKKYWEIAAKVGEVVWEVISGIGSFIGGVVYGFVESIYDLIAGVVELIKDAVNFTIDLFSGKFYSEMAALFKELVDLGPKGLKKLLEEAIQEIGKTAEGMWDNFTYKLLKEPDTVKRSFFQGEVLGYIIAEVVIAFFTAGIGTGIKAAKWLKTIFGILKKLGGRIKEILEALLEQYRKVRKLKTPDKKKSYDHQGGEFLDEHPNRKEVEEPKENRSEQANSSGEVDLMKHPLRLAYEEEVSKLKQLGEELLNSKKYSKKQVAEILHSKRRQLGLKYKDATPIELREYIYKMNLNDYGDELGPTIEYLREIKNKSWDEIIESASRPGGRFNREYLLNKFPNDQQKLIKILDKYNIK